MQHFEFIISTNLKKGCPKTVYVVYGYKTKFVDDLSLSDNLLLPLRVVGLFPPRNWSAMSYAVIYDRMSFVIQFVQHHVIRVFMRYKECCSHITAIWINFTRKQRLVEEHILLVDSIIKADHYNLWYL